MHIFKKWPEVEVAGDPGNIHWTNVGVPWPEKKCRVSISWLSFVFALLVCLMLLVVGKK